MRMMPPRSGAAVPTMLGCARSTHRDLVNRKATLGSQGRQARQPGRAELPPLRFPATPMPANDNQRRGSGTTPLSGRRERGPPQPPRPLAGYSRSARRPAAWRDSQGHGADRFASRAVARRAAVPRCPQRRRIRGHQDVSWDPPPEPGAAALRSVRHGKCLLAAGQAPVWLSLARGQLMSR